MKTQLIVVPPGKNCDNHGEGVYILVADTGEVLCSHFCSGIGFAKSDLATGRRKRWPKWDEKYPEGWEVVHLADANISPEELFKRNQAFPI
jgi:hypothetical protein